MKTNTQCDLEECKFPCDFLGFPDGSVTNLLAVWETRGSIPGSGRFLEKEMASQSSILAWRIPRTEEPGRLHCCKEWDTTERLTLSGNQSRTLLGWWTRFPCLPAVSLQCAEGVLVPSQVWGGGSRPQTPHPHSVQKGAQSRVSGNCEEAGAVSPFRLESWSARPSAERPQGRGQNPWCQRPWTSQLRSVPHLIADSLLLTQWWNRPVAVLVSYACCKKSPHNKWLKTAHIRNPPTLSMGMRSGTATLEDSMEVPLKV